MRFILGLVVLVVLLRLAVWWLRERGQGAAPVTPERLLMHAAYGFVTLVEAVGRGFAVVAHRLSSLAGVIVSVVVLAGGALVGPPLFDHLVLQDKVREICRAPVADADVADRIAHAIHRRRMDRVLAADACHIQTSEKWRTIRCRYRAPLGFGRVRLASLPLSIDVEEPLFPADPVAAPGVF